MKKVTETAMKADNHRFEPGPEPGFEYPDESPLRLAHRALRGRYRSAAIVAALLAAVGGAVGYLASPAKYVSRGLVHIEGAFPTILYPTQENQVPPMFDAYVASQVAFLQSGKLLAEAVDLPEMAEVGWHPGPRGVSALYAAVTVNRGRGEQTIAVSVEHRDPNMAHVAVNAILSVYGKSVPDPGGLSLPAKERALVQREESLNALLREFRLRVLEHSGQYGRDAIEQTFAAKVDELMVVDERLEQIRLALRQLDAGGESALAGTALGTVHLGVETPLSPLREKELALLAEIESLSYAPGHPIIRNLRRQLEAIRIQMELRQGDSNDLDVPMRTRLVELEAANVAVRDRLGEQTAVLGRQRIVLAGLSEQVAEIGQRLATTRRRLDEIRFVAGLTNAERITIVRGELPGLPASDRRAKLSAAGVVFGAAGGVAFVVLIGLRDRRIRFVDELVAMNLPATVIGVIPVSTARDDPRATAAAVDRLRLQLQVQRGEPERNIHVLTSCGRGEAKADLALALGASFAETGLRTLVVDADFVSAALSRKLGLADRPGMRDGLGGRACTDTIHATGDSRLRAMPVGSSDGVEPREFTRKTVRRLYDDLRHQFDAIVVDAGPVGADIEACLVTAESDHVVLVVDRDEHGETVREAVSRLEQLGIDGVGMLFNKAIGPDVRTHADVDPGTSTSLHLSIRGADEEDPSPPARVTGEMPMASHATSERKRAA